MGILLFISPSDIVIINELSLILKIIITCEVKQHCYVIHENNNVSFEELDIHYHSSFNRNRCDTSDNVCVGLIDKSLMQTLHRYL